MPETVGDFPIEVEVEDSAGNVARSLVEIKVTAVGESETPPEIQCR
jgi:hypothetical protein